MKLQSRGDKDVCPDIHNCQWCVVIGKRVFLNWPLHKEWRTHVIMSHCRTRELTHPPRQSPKSMWQYWHTVRYNLPWRIVWGLPWWFFSNAQPQHHLSQWVVCVHARACVCVCERQWQQKWNFTYTVCAAIHWHICMCVRMYTTTANSTYVCNRWWTCN